MFGCLNNKFKQLQSYLNMEHSLNIQSNKQQFQSEKMLKTDKINYKQKNLSCITQELIQKIKQKKLKQIQQKQLQQKRQQTLREKLKKKILEEAQKVRQNKQKQNNRVIQIPKTENSIKNSHKQRRPQCQSLPKVNPDKDDSNKEKYKNRYLDFLSNLSEGIKSKKQIQQMQKRKKQQKYQKLKQQLGVTKVQSKLTKLLERPQLERSQSAQKLSQLRVKQQQLMPKSNKYFQGKHTQYLQKIKKKREAELFQKQQQQKKIEMRKQKLKQFVMNTVKRNVLEGVYDDQLDKKKKTKPKAKFSEDNNQQKNQQNNQSQSETQSQNENIQQQNKNKKRKMRAFPYVTDLNQWKKKNRLTPDIKVFIITGGYADVKKSLKNRGWVQNPDHNSPCFDLKWTLQGRQIDYENIHDFQIVNHFQKNGAITTKVGLCKNIRNMVWVNNIDIDTFYPKCFDLNDDDDYAHFQEYFKICKAQSILLLYLKLYTNKQIEQLQKLKLRAKIAFQVCKRNIIDIDDIIDKKKNPLIVTAKQWQVLASDELSTQGLAKKKHQQWLHSIDMKYNDKKMEKVTKKKKKVKKEQNKQQKNQKQQKEQKNQAQVDQFTKQVIQLIDTYEQKFPQFSLSDIYNTWILKPAGLSRGRGITCYNNLVQIQDHIKSKQSLWVAQKYIQNPLIIAKRKFDIRQWVLVTDFNPLIIWFYEQCYIRFSVLDYNAQQVNNKFIHLTNNAIASLHKNFQTSTIKGNMFSMEQFSQYLIKKQGADVFNQKIKPQMKDIVKWSLESAQQYIQNRKNSHQLFGYDFMVDQNYKVWLIQINSSPSMDYSTHITTRLVKQGLEDTIKVVVDYNGAPKKLRKTIDTGKYKLIFKGKEIPQKPITTGLNLGIQGIAMKKNSKKASIKPSSVIVQSKNQQKK